MPKGASLSDDYAAERKKARRYLIKGLLFLFACLVVAYFAENVEFPFNALVAESGYIAGWVALWRPMEMYLYDLPELRRSLKQAEA